MLGSASPYCFGDPPQTGIPPTVPAASRHGTPAAAMGFGHHQFRLEMLPAHILVDIAHHLRARGRHALSSACRHLRGVLGTVLVLDRAAARIDRAISPSTFRHAILAIWQAPAHEQEALFSDLAARLPALHDSMAVLCLDHLLDAIDALHPDVRRGGILSRLSQANPPPQYPASRVHRRILDAMRVLPVHERARPLANWLSRLSSEDFSVEPVAAWFDEAAALAAHDGGHALAELARALFLSEAAEWRDIHQHGLHAVRAMARAHGGLSGAAATVLRALGENLRTEAGGDGSMADADATKGWDDLLEAGRALPAADAATVLATLAMSLPYLSPDVAQRGWACLTEAARTMPQQHGAIVIAGMARTPWSAQFGARRNEVLALLSTLADAVRGPVLEALAETLEGVRAVEERQAQWVDVLEAATTGLPADQRAATLTALAQALTTMRAGIGPRAWPLVAAHAALLPPALQAPLLAKCLRTSRGQAGLWNMTFGRTHHLPPEHRGPALEALAATLSAFPDATEQRARYLEVLRLMLALPAEHLDAPLQGLMRAASGLTASEQRAEIRSLLADMLSRRPPSTRATLLATFASRLTRRECWQWALDCTLALPRVYRPEALSALASAAANRLQADGGPEPCWPLLASAAGTLPGEYRASTVIALSQLATGLPATSRAAAWRELDILLLGIPPMDLPPDLQRACPAAAAGDGMALT
jgi:hypothetical protein